MRIRIEYIRTHTSHRLAEGVKQFAAWQCFDKLSEKLLVFPLNRIHPTGGIELSGIRAAQYHTRFALLVGWAKKHLHSSDFRTAVRSPNIWYVQYAVKKTIHCYTITHTCTLASGNSSGSKTIELSLKHSLSLRSCAHPCECGDGGVYVCEHNKIYWRRLFKSNALLCIRKLHTDIRVARVAVSTVRSVWVVYVFSAL